MYIFIYLAGNWHGPLEPKLSTHHYSVSVCSDFAPLFLWLAQIHTGRFASGSDKSCGVRRLIGRSLLS